MCYEWITWPERFEVPEPSWWPVRGITPAGCQSRSIQYLPSKLFYVTDLSLGVTMSLCPVAPCPIWFRYFKWWLLTLSLQPEFSTQALPSFKQCGPTDPAPPPISHMPLVSLLVAVRRNVRLEIMCSAPCKVGSFGQVLEQAASPRFGGA